MNNAVFIPVAAWSDDQVDPSMCEKLRMEGDRHNAELFTEDGTRKYVLREENYYSGDTFLFPAGLRGEYPSGDSIRLLPDMWVLKQDETEYWSDYQEHGITRIFGVYVLNRRKVVHLCEMTPSYELVFMGSQYEGGGDDADDYIQEGDRWTEEYSYQHCHEVDDQLKNIIQEGYFGVGGYPVTGLVSVTEEGALEELREVNCSGGL